MKRRIVDLFACAGGAGKGLSDAGFEVIGVDLKKSKRNPHPVIEADALDLPVEFLRMFDAIWASPPCQGLTEMNNDKSRWLNLIPQTRALCKASGLPYVLENVRAARSELVNPVSLFGTMFGCSTTSSTGQKFVLSRERLFETNWPLHVPLDPGTGGLPVANVYGGHFRVRSGEFRTGKGTGRTVDLPGEDRAAMARDLMGMPWASMHEISEAVPPAYAKYIGGELMRYLEQPEELPPG